MGVLWRVYVDPHNNLLVGSPSMGASLYIKYVPLTNKPAQSTDTISDESTQIRATLTQPLNRRFVQDCVVAVIEDHTQFHGTCAIGSAEPVFRTWRTSV
jgi:hypothetical protein